MICILLTEGSGIKPGTVQPVASWGVDPRRLETVSASPSNTRVFVKTQFGLCPTEGARLVPELLQDNENHVTSDWGSSGRRFKSCQPEHRSEALSNPTQARECLAGRDDWNPGGRPDPRRHRLPETAQTQMSLVCWRRALSSFLVPFPFLGVLFSGFAGRERRRQRG
jgi:hypothetical protein